jgi:membrane fusion protein, copper/silver efflux system
MNRRLWFLLAMFLSGMANAQQPLPDHAPLTLSLERQQLIGVKFGHAEKKVLFKSVRAPGRVAFDPELYNAQNEYREALRQFEQVKDSTVSEIRTSAGRMVQSAKLRLKLLGLSDSQIQALQGSSAEGPNLLLSQPGADLYIYAEISEFDVPSLHPGLAAEISVDSAAGKNIAGKVVSVDRVINSATRTAKARILAPGAKAYLRPESFVNVTILVPLGEQVAVPLDAVLDTGEKAWIFVKKSDGTLEPRSVQIRFRAGDDVAIAGGVGPGEEIVTSANLLVDSESKLRASHRGAGAKAEPQCPKGQSWDGPMAMCM